MSELRIYFVDLIAFVPTTDGSIWILLPEARQPTLASDGVTRIDPHFPIVLFDLPNQGGDWQLIHQILKLTPPIGNHEAWLLDRQELRIAIPPSLPVQKPGAASTGLPQPVNRTHFTWVPNLAALGIPAQVDPGCLLPAGTSSGQTPSPKIVARLHLQKGELTTFQFVKRSLTTFPYQLRVPQLEFRPLGGGAMSGTARACADSVVAIVPFTGPTIDLLAVDLDTGLPVPGRSIQLRENASGVINLLVGNLSPVPTAGTDPPFGVHFERFYGLLPALPATRPIPYLDSGFPTNPATHTSTTGINGLNPTFIRTALQVPFAGFNRPICSLATLQS